MLMSVQAFASQTVMKVLEHPTAVSPDRAKTDGWYINWCGVGDAGKPGAKRGGKAVVTESLKSTIARVDDPRS